MHQTSIGHTCLYKPTLLPDLHLEYSTKPGSRVVKLKFIASTPGSGPGYPGTSSLNRGVPGYPG
eukprot:2582986-Rhodomonas_salina.1